MSEDADPAAGSKEASPDVWALTGALEEIRSINRDNPARSFAFILGAGASVGSGIPSGQSMADAWIREMHSRVYPAQSFADWIEGGGPNIVGLTEKNIAEYYPAIFERRFGADKEGGYARLEALMDGKEPSLGYSLLAEIMKETRHRIVITTNFDNLVVDALAMHAHKPPLVVGHESLTGFIHPRQRRPLVAKIHRDLFLAPRSDVAEVSTLEKGWQDALRNLFKENTPIVIGYGGNDGSLMGLLKSLKPGEIAGQMFWCFRPGSPPNAMVRQAVAQHNGVLVPISGFDDFMLRLIGCLIPDFDLGRISTRLERLGRTRAERYRAQAEEIRRRAGLEAAAAASNRAGNDDGESTTREIMADALRDESNWWTWEMRAKAQMDFDARERIYLDALAHLPDNPDLLLNYAQLLERANKRAEASEQFDRAMHIKPKDPAILRSYATFRSRESGRLDEAEVNYRKALDLDPYDAQTVGKYAEFLAYCRDDLDAANEQFVKALGLDPTSAALTRSYATFLISKRQNIKDAEAMYEKAMELNPDDALTNGNLAYFVEREKGDLDRSESLYRKAIDIDPLVALNLANFGAFLLRKRGKVDEAESVYKKLLALSPGHSANTGAYLDLLLNHKRDFAGAERAVKEALAYEPDNPNNAVNLAAVQLCQGLVKEARTSARNAIALVEPKASQIVAEALFYEAIISEMSAQDAGPALSRLKGLLEKGYDRMLWGFLAVLETALAGASKDRRAFFDLIASAILDKKACVRLSKNPMWKAIPSLDPATSL